MYTHFDWDFSDFQTPRRKIEEQSKVCSVCVSKSIDCVDIEGITEITLDCSSVVRLGLRKSNFGKTFYFAHNIILVFSVFSK